MANSWCKVDSNLDNHPKVRMAGNLGRQVFEFALRRNAQPGNAVEGMLPAIMLEPWYVADQLMMSVGDATVGLERAVNAGLLERHGESYQIAGWTAHWGKAASDNAIRQAQWRARQKDRNNASNVMGNVTVTTSNVDQIRSEEIRLEEKRSDQPAKPARRRKTIPPEWSPSASERKLAAELGLDLEHEAREFQSYWLGEGRPKLDWDQTFHNRLLAQGKRTNGAKRTGRLEPRPQADFTTGEREL